VEAFKAGAHDFLAKGRLARLIPAIERELREAEIRRQKRRFEDELRASEHRYRQIVETTREGLVMTDLDGQISYVNPRMGELLGTSPDRIIGRSMFDFLIDTPKHDKSRPWRSDKDRYEVGMRRVDGTTFWAAASVAPRVNDEGEQDGDMAMLSDVTEQRQLRAQLMVTDRMASVGTLAAGVGHEINNPLAAAFANVQLAIERLSESDSTGPAAKEALEMLNDSQEALHRVRTIVRDLRIFARAEEDTRGAVDVHRVIESSLRMASNEIRHRAKLVTALEPVPLVDANESRLGQVLLNLVMNAAQAISVGDAESNLVRVSSHLNGKGQVLVEIEDSGTGIAPEALPKLFQPFYTTKPKGVGTGLGLAICHRIVSDFGGSISVESRLGKGTKFCVALNQATAETPAKPEEAVLPPTPPTRRGRILVIDDEPMVGVVVQRTLEHDHLVVTETQGSDGLSRLLHDSPDYDVILCDLMMPQMSGVELYERIEKLVPRYKDCVIFLTGGAFTPQAHDFLSTFNGAHMEKPFEPQHLRRIIAAKLS
jgi:PAS domain S-box-containing protein